MPEYLWRWESTNTIAAGDPCRVVTKQTYLKSSDMDNMSRASAAIHTFEATIIAIKYI